MSEIRPDLNDKSRCISVHWSLPVQCVLPRTHLENWHEAWHPSTGNRIRYRRSYGVYRTEELTCDWNRLPIPPPSTALAESVADAKRWHDTYQQHAGDFDYGPLRTYEITWGSGQIEKVQGHELNYIDGGVFDEPCLRRFLIRGMFNGGWRLVLTAPAEDIRTIRDVTEGEWVL